MIHRIQSLDDPRVAPYAALTEAQLRNRLHPADALFIVESPKVIMTALQSGLTPVSLLCEERHISGDAAPIMAGCPGLDVYTADRQTLQSLTGYTLTRGVLCAMRRPPETPLNRLLEHATRTVVIDGVTDTTNIGAIFRSAAALGIDAVLLTRTACDPLNRRSVRVSMGSVFLVPWGWLDSYDLLRDYGFTTAAMALTDDSISLDDPRLKTIDKLALIMGTEGDGLRPETIARADAVVRIPMANGVDSLNVAAAAAVAFWELRKR